jgi:tagatose-1,6-bisphosphate aldolase
MGIGKITRTAGKVGLAMEVGRYAFLAGRALWRAVKSRDRPATSNQQPDREHQPNGDNRSEE